MFTARSSHQSRDVLLKKCSKKFRKFHRKRPLLEFLFKKPAGLTPILKNMCQRLLLCCTRTTRCYLSVLLLLLISPMFNFGSNSKGFKESEFYFSFSVKALSSVLFPFSMFVLSFSVLLQFLLSLLIKRILLID